MTAGVVNAGRVELDLVAQARDQVTATLKEANRSLAATKAQMDGVRQSAAAQTQATNATAAATANFSARLSEVRERVKPLDAVRGAFESLRSNFLSFPTAIAGIVVGLSELLDSLVHTATASEKIAEHMEEAKKAATELGAATDKLRVSAGLETQANQDARKEREKSRDALAQTTAQIERLQHAIRNYREAQEAVTKAGATGALVWLQNTQTLVDGEKHLAEWVKEVNELVRARDAYLRGEGASTVASLRQQTQDIADARDEAEDLFKKNFADKFPLAGFNVDKQTEVTDNTAEQTRKRYEAIAAAEDDLRRKREQEGQRQAEFEEQAFREWMDRHRKMMAAVEEEQRQAEKARETRTLLRDLSVWADQSVLNEGEGGRATSRSGLGGKGVLGGMRWPTPQEIEVKRTLELADAYRSVGQIVDSLAPALDTLGASAGGVARGFGAALGSVASFVAGDWLGGITGVIGAITGLFSDSTRKVRGIMRDADRATNRTGPSTIIINVGPGSDPQSVAKAVRQNAYSTRGTGADTRSPGL